MPDSTSSFKEQLKYAKVQRRFWEVLIEDHDKHLSAAMIVVRAAQLGLENVKSEYISAPAEIVKCDRRIKTIEFGMKKNIQDPKVKKILILRAKLAKLEADA